MPQFRRWLKWVIKSLFGLIAGLFVCHVFWALTHHRYVHPPQGFYTGHIGLSFYPAEEPYFDFSARAEAPTRWYWHSPPRFAYTTATIRSWSLDGPEFEGSIDFSTMSYSVGGSNGPITADLLHGWLMPGDQSDIARLRAEVIYTNLLAVSAGQAPPPRHHTNRFRDPYMYSIQHGLSGLGVPTIALVWVVAWLLLTTYRGYCVWRELHGAAKPVEPAGTSSSPSHLITSHTSGESPGGSLRR